MSPPPLRTQCGGCDSRTKECGDSASAHFATWFDTTFAVSDPQLKSKAILASQDAALAVLVEACQSWEGPMEGPGHCQPKATHSDPDTRLKYQVEMADI